MGVIKGDTRSLDNGSNGASIGLKMSDLTSNKREAVE